MPSDQKDRYIRYLVDKVNELDLDKRAMELAVEEFQSTHDSVMESLGRLQREMAELKGELSAERSRCKAAESKSRKLEQQLKFAQKNWYGDKRQNARRKEDDAEEKSDRNNEKEGFDGTDGTLSTGSVGQPSSAPASTPGKKERDTSNRSDTYKVMS